MKFSQYRTLITLLIVLLAAVPPLLSYQPWNSRVLEPLSQVQQNQAAAVELASLSDQTPLRLITEPEDGIQEVGDDIEQAQKSVDLVIYELEDPDIEQKLVDAKNRGVSVRVILQNVNSFGTHPNQVAYDFLQSNDVPVKWAASYFALTHQKTLIVDGDSALIMTFNLSPQYYASSRDFGIRDTDSKDVAAIAAAFDSDWNGREEVASNGSDLVWSPGSAPTLLALIVSASSTLEVYNEEMADPRMTHALEDAAARGVLVRVDMTYATNWKDEFNELLDSGVQVHTYASSADRYIHAKMIIADGKTAFLGSENFSHPSLDSNRELGILISRPDILESLEQTFSNDWAEARVYKRK